MKKICAFLLTLNFLVTALFGSNSKIPANLEKEKTSFLFKSETIKKNISDDVLQAVADMCQNLQQIINSYQGVEEQVLNLLQTSFDLTSQILKKEQKDSTLIYSLFSQLVCDLFEILELHKIEVSSFGQDFAYMSTLAKAKTRDSRKNFAKEIIESKDEKSIKEFTGEFFIVLSGYFKRNVEIVIEDMQSKLLLCFEDNILEENDEPLIFKRGKKKRIAAAIFSAIANTCILLAQIITGKTQEDQKEGVLNLAGTVFGLAAQINMINAEYADNNRVIKATQESILNLTVQLAENLYKVVKQDNILLDHIAESYLWQKLDSLDSSEKRIAWLTEALLSRNLSKKLVKALLKCLKTCLHHVMDEVVDLLNDKLLELLIKYAAK